MSQATNFAEQTILNALFRSGSLGVPANWHYGLLSAVSDLEAGTVTELSGTGYARQAVAPGSGTFKDPATATQGETSPNAIVNWTNSAAAAWGSPTHVGIYDAATGGNLWFVIPLGVAPGAIAIGNKVEAAANALKITLG